MLILYLICLLIFLIPICTLITYEIYKLSIYNTLFKKILIENKKNHNSIRIAKSYIQRRQWVKCIKILEKELTKDKIVHHNYIGYCYSRMNLYSLSEQHYLTALREDPHNITSLLGLANIYKSTKRQKQALEKYRQISQIDSSKNYRDFNQF